MDSHKLSLAIQHGLNGTYRIFGDARPLLFELETEKRNVDCGASPKRYYALLDKITSITFSPVAEYLEINSLPPEYIDFKSSYKKNGPYTFRKFVAEPTSNIIATVRIITPDTIMNPVVTVAPLKVFKGEIPADGKIKVQSIPTFENGWFLKDEKCLIFCCIPRESSGPVPYTPGPISLGPCGRLPFDDDTKSLISFAYSEEFWTDFPSYFKHGLHFVDSASVLHYLSRVSEKSL